MYLYSWIKTQGKQNQSYMVLLEHLYENMKVKASELDIALTILFTIGFLKEMNFPKFEFDLEKKLTF